MNMNFVISTLRAKTRRALWPVGAAALLALLVVWAAAPSPAAAATITVNAMIDQINHEGDCSLREAIVAANLDQAVDACPAGNGADTIIVPAGIYEFLLDGAGKDEASTGDLDITDDLSIIGSTNGVSMVTAVYSDRVFHILDAQVEFRNLVISEGGPPNGPGGGIFVDNGYLTLINTVVQHSDISTTPTYPTPGFSRLGGGIYVGGHLIIDNSDIIDNAADFGGGIFVETQSAATISESWIDMNYATISGGGIANEGLAIIQDTTISANHTWFDFKGSIHGGGGVASSGVLFLANSTLSGNTANSFGGGLGIFPEGVAHLHNVTITNNTADANQSDLGDGGGIINISGTVTLRNTIIVANHDASTSGDDSPDCTGTPIESLDYNLIQKMDGCTLTGQTSHNKTGVAPLLGPLQDNGGPTLTHALLPKSPAIDGGNPNGCLDHKDVMLITDQRGHARPVNGDQLPGAICDIGAFEHLSAGPPTATATATPTVTTTPFAPTDWLYLPSILGD
jgi:hypothetical protein